jgi:hypothetical protein
LPDSIEFKRGCIEPGHPQLSVRQQCELLGLNRSSWYYEPMGESAENLALMRRIDEQYLKTPCYGRRKMKPYPPATPFQSPQVAQRRQRFPRVVSRSAARSQQLQRPFRSQNLPF